MQIGIIGYGILGKALKSRIESNMKTSLLVYLLSDQNI